MTTLRYEICKECKGLVYIEATKYRHDCLFCSHDVQEVKNIIGTMGKKSSKNAVKPSHDAIEGFETLCIPEECVREPYPTLRRLAEL